MTTHFFANKDDYLNFRAAWAKFSQEGYMSATDHLLYNLIRGKAPEHGFTPKTKPSKLRNGHSPNQALADAAFYLRCRIERGEVPFWAKDVLTEEQIKSIECPKISRIDPDFGRGRAVCEAIISKGEISWDEIHELLEAA